MELLAKAAAGLDIWARDCPSRGTRLLRANRDFCSKEKKGLMSNDYFDLLENKLGRATEE